jgi:ABC-type multidrug transport system ATPase subunit
MEIAIKTVNLTKYYGDLLAVDHINFEVKQGEIWVFRSKWSWKNFEKTFQI